ncbi:HpcH/HpaI aldolase/citrate lyase family protein [Amycolatopsis aidingensis]|uniref:HpcH/HpaI aldolase/citrate lyase family protein n=1 Tax=Amycolatopsis aidingensis TaxID=2842453 RepID=UPI001C0D4A14|nr:CoA ester lyase [Amycolatopsis aidingensis]
MTGPASARSWLFVPGDRPERFGKAAGSGADAVVCDLEDAVAPEHKVAARDAVRGWLATNPAFVRVNATDTEWHADDLAALADVPGLRGLLLPKSEQVDQLHELARILPERVAVVALVETALGVHEATSLARVPGVCRLAFGSLDFALDAGTGTGQEELRYARSRLVLSSRVAGIASPVDGVTTDLDDPDRCARDARAARLLGFGGKLAVHPHQVEVLNQAFLPTAAEVDWARRVLTAVAESGTSAVRVDGQLVDRPRVELARGVLAGYEEER